MLAATVAAAMLLTQSAQQFDLFCNEVVEQGGDYLETTAESSTIRLRVDLERRVWCASVCEAIQPIHSFDSNEIIFQDYESEHLAVYRRVSRLTGGYSVVITTDINGDKGWNRSAGNCQRMPFTGIPQARF